MEILLAIAVVLLAALGLGAGLLLGAGPPKTSCGAASCLPGTACEDCPLRKARARMEEAQ